MPGLYKRKRPTLNSSQINNTSVWHSTPVGDDTSASGGGRAPGIDDPPDEDLFDSMIQSPSKRQAVGDGAHPTPSQAPHAAAALDSDEELFVATGGNNNVPPVSDDREHEEGFHTSVRFGPVVINRPSGHAYFASVLHKNGFIVSLPKNHLMVDVVVFRKSMEDWLIKNNDENSRIENETSKFLPAVNKYFMDKDNLRHSFTTTLNDTEFLQPSLLHCVLGVPFLQPYVLKAILPLLAEASYSHTQDEIDVVENIMTQMKWLPILVDGKSLASGLLDILENANTPSQKHIIRLLPEIFSPEFHPDLVPKLLEIFESGTSLNVSMLDCFASLRIPEADCAKIRCKAVEQMATAHLKDISAYFAFMFRGGSLGDLQEAINEIREKVEITSNGKDTNSVAYQVEILERIRFCVAVNDGMIKQWIAKIKDDLNFNVELKTLDFIMLFVFAESAEKSAFVMLRHLFESKVLVCKLFDKLIAHNQQIVFELFSPLAQFLDSVLRTKDSKGHDAAVIITWKMFITLGPIKAQHLTSNLIGVIINGHPSCRDVALKIFTKIAKTDPTKLLYFYHYLMGALVYVIKFPPRQMQALMNVLAILANVPENVSGQTNTFTIEFMILLRKQLSHTNLQTRCFGVLGTLAAVRELSSHPPADEDKINELLELAWASTERDEEACSIFFDELSTCVRMLPKAVCAKFRDILKTKFEETWTVDQDSESQVLRSSQGQAGLVLTSTFDANKEMERDSILVTLEPKVFEMSPLVVPSHLRVMVELEKFVEDGVLEGVDAVLGCPILFPKLDKYYEQDSLDDYNFNQRMHLGKYLALVTNYFRECISAFAESDNPELRLKVWLRFINIITLQKLWTTHLYSLPNLPPAYGAEISMSSTNSGAGFSGGFKPGANKKKPAKPKGKATKKKPKKKKNNENEEEDVEDEDEDQEEEEEEEKVAKAVKSIELEDVIQPKALLPYLRRLDPQVFNFVKYPLNLTKEQVDFTGIMLNISNATQSEVTMKSIESFTAETLSFLLIEIKQQASDKTNKLDILSIPDLLPSLCSHMDIITNNGKTEPGQQPQINSCLRLIIKTMILYFDAVMHLEDADRKASVIEGSILMFSQRSKGSSQDTEEQLPPTQRSLLENAAKYIMEICDFVDVSCDTPTAHEHIKLLKTLHDLLPIKDEFKHAIDDVVKVYLRRNWKLPAAVIDFFLKTWLAVTPQLMKTVHHLTRELIPLPTDKKSKPEPIPKCSRYKSCSKINFHTWYAALFASLAQHVHKHGRQRGDFAESYQFWKDTVDLFRTLVLLSQQLKKPIILVPLLKHSRVYIEAFISGAVCLLPELWKTDAVDGQIFIKKLQASTRRIQMICEHSKVIKDNNLMRYVPLMKKVLETLVYKVREALANYGAASAFWMGSLKHKDLDGNEMSSQPFRRSESQVVDSSDDDSSVLAASNSNGDLDEENEESVELNLSEDDESS